MAGEKFRFSMFIPREPYHYIAVTDYVI